VWPYRLWKSNDGDSTEDIFSKAKAPGSASEAFVFVDMIPLQTASCFAQFPGFLKVLILRGAFTRLAYGQHLQVDFVIGDEPRVFGGNVPPDLEHLVAVFIPHM